MAEHKHQRGTPTHVNKYAEPTVELVLLLLAQAYEDEAKLDKYLKQISEEVFAELIKALEELVKKGKFKWDTKINLMYHSDLYQTLKHIEREQLQKFIDYCWIGAQVIEESMVRAYQNTVFQTFAIYNKPIPSLTATIQIRDTNIKRNIIQVPWCQDGKIYSERLYGHVSQFQQKLAFVLEEGISKGKGMEWMMASWRKLTGSTAYDTARLLKTETMAMWSLATKSSLLEMGIEYVEIVGDAECGGVCLDYVGEAIPLKEAVIGDLLPPYHPNCACSFVEYIEATSAEEAVEEEEEEVY